MANFAYSKVGLNLNFEFYENKGNFFSGADDWVKLLINLSFNNPNDNFYIIGQNNFDKISIHLKEKWFPHKNVYNTLENAAKDLNNIYRAPLEWLNKNNVNLDYGIIVLGPVLARNIPNTTYTLQGTIAKPLDRGKRSVAPVWHTLNETGIKWVCMSDDPRTLKLSQDLFNLPYAIFAQVNSILKNKNIISYEDQNWIETEICTNYKTIEISNCLDEKIIPVDDSWKTRNTKLGLALNQSGNDETLNGGKLSNGHRPRYPILKEWILDSYDKSHVYGKWPEEIQNSSVCFRGSINRQQLYPEMKNWKHSLCIPIDIGWATAKYLEYLKCGVSPFLHPDYDSQKNTNMTEYFRVSSVEEFKDKINDKEDVHIEEINKGIKSCLSDEHISGQKINDIIYSALGLKRNIKNKIRELWTCESNVSTLDKFLK
jgi:hypothetical protein